MSVQQPGGGEGGEELQERLSADEIHFTLSNCRRRFLLRYLSREEERTVKELSRAIAAWENDVPAAELSYGDRKTVYTALLQTHLPKLDEMGVVEYDSCQKRVRLTNRAAQLQPYLEPEEKSTDADRRPYGMALWILLAAAALGVIVGRYSVAGLEGTMLTMLSFGVAAGVAVGFALAATTKAE
jgi:hypothetical protein